MNRLLEWLQGGDLRSDGLSMEVVRFVLDHPELLPDLMQGLLVEDDIVRGRAADAIEHIAREIPEDLLPNFAMIKEAMLSDPIPMVRWHLAMVLGHLAIDLENPEEACDLLVDCLSDSSVFFVSWAIVSLCIYASLYPDLQEEVLDQIASLGSSPSVAIRSKVINATQVIRDGRKNLPKGWVKSEKIKIAIDDALKL
jgi:HEAT repeat protein